MDFVLQRWSGLLKRIVVLFDRYRWESIKATARSRRSKNMVQIVGRGIAGREVPLQVFLALDRRQENGLSTFSLRRTYRASIRRHYSCRIWWLFKLKAIFFF